MAKFNVTYSCGHDVARNLTVDAGTTAYIKRMGKRPCRHCRSGADVPSGADGGDDVKAAVKAANKRRSERKRAAATADAS